MVLLIRQRGLGYVSCQARPGEAQLRATSEILPYKSGNLIREKEKKAVFIFVELIPEGAPLWVQREDYKHQTVEGVYISAFMSNCSSMEKMK